MQAKTPVKGNLLVSQPSIIGDISFSRSVVLLTEYDSKGVVGFILNKPLNYTLNEILPEIDINLPVYQGGPVDMDNLYFLHTAPELIPNSHLISDNIYWGGDFQVVNQLFKDNLITGEQIKFFLGYAGWEQDQLANEIEQHSWVLRENRLQEDLLQFEESKLGKDEMRDLGGNYEIWSNAPENPSFN